MLRRHSKSPLFASLLLSALLGSPLVFGQIIGADPAACQGESSVCTHHMSTYSWVSLTEGNAAETYSVARAMSAFGPTLSFDLTYNSYNADGNRAQVDTGIGFGWTHTYNDFLFIQGNDLFRWGPDGRVTKFKYTGDAWETAPGYFETLTANNDGSFTITTKHQTKFRYQVAPGKRHPKGPFANNPIYQLTSITDRNNNVTTLSYAGGYLSSITDTYGRSITLTYNGNFHLASITDPLGRVTTLTYDGLTGTQLTAITDPLGHTTSYQYDNQNQITQKLDRDGRKFTITYASQNPIVEFDGNNAPVYKLSNPGNWATDPNQLNQNALRVYIPSTTTQTDGVGNAWQYAYDSNGFPLTITAPDSATTTYTYDPNTLRVASKTDANGHTTSYMYDSQGNLIKKTDANNNVTQYTYEPNFNQMASMTDSNGRTTSYTYDGSGNRISETDALGHTATMAYDSHGNLLTLTDKRNNTTTYVYDAFGNRVKSTDALNEITKSTYDTVGNLTSTTDPLGRLTTYQYDPLNRLTIETDALNGTVKTFYDGEGNKIKVTDQNGITTSYGYDGRSRLSTKTDGLGKTTTYGYDGNNNQTTVKDRLGRVTTFGYDTQNRATSRKDPLGHTWNTVYDPAGNKITEIDADGNATSYNYDGLNRRIQMVDGVGATTTYGYDLTGLPGCGDCTGPAKGSSKLTEQIDGNGKYIYWAYDTLDRLAVELHKQGSNQYAIGPNDAVIRYTYDENSNQVTMTDPVGNTTTNTFDAVNRLTETVNAAGDTWLTTYDGDGNVAVSQSPNLNTTVYTRDALNRVIQVDDSEGRVSNSTYDAVGNLLTFADGNGHTTTNGYDADYRLTSVMDALGDKTVYTYDAEGNLLMTTDRMGNSTTNTYDNANRLTTTVLAGGNTITHTYDPQGNITVNTDPNGHGTFYTYDGDNRLVVEQFADTSVARYAYDDAGNLIQHTNQNGFTTFYTYSDLNFLTQRSYASDPPDNFTYDFAGRLLTAEKGGWLDTFQYDQRNFVTQSIQNGQVLKYFYNIQGEQRFLYYPGGFQPVIESTDARGRLSDIGIFMLTGVVQYSYDAANNVVTRALANGVTATVTNNANNWVTKLNHDVGNTRIADFNYNYDKVGNRTFEQKLPDSSPGQNQTAQLNSIYQMMGFKSTTISPTIVPKTLTPPSTQTQISFDQAGNWPVKVTDGVTENRTHNLVNEITSINGMPLTYDANGNLLQDTKYTYTYDQNDRLTSVSTNTAHPTMLEQIRYDAFGRRVEKIGSPHTRLYLYDNMRIVEEQDLLHQPIAIYVYGNGLDELLMAQQMGSGAQYFYQQNALGSVSAVTDTIGNPLERYVYDAFGRPTVTDGNGIPVPKNPSGTPHSAIGNPWMFNNRFLDEETGLFDYRSRAYHTDLGRFLQQDSIGNWGDSGNLGNGYAYVANNPSSHADPLGLDANMKIVTFKVTLCHGKDGCWTVDSLQPCEGLKLTSDWGCTNVVGIAAGGGSGGGWTGGFDNWGSFAAAGRHISLVKPGGDPLTYNIWTGQDTWSYVAGGGSGFGGGFTNSREGAVQNSPMSLLGTYNTTKSNIKTPSAMFSGPSGVGLGPVGMGTGTFLPGTTYSTTKSNIKVPPPMFSGPSGLGLGPVGMGTGTFLPGTTYSTTKSNVKNPSAMFAGPSTGIITTQDGWGCQSAPSGPRNTRIGTGGNLGFGTGGDWGSGGPANLQNGGGTRCHTIRFPDGSYVIICCGGSCCCGVSSDDGVIVCSCEDSGGGSAY